MTIKLSIVLASRERSGLMTYGGFILALLVKDGCYTSVDLFSVIKIAFRWPVGLPCL